jgi:DNA-binding transcriptional ArsR family regulator
MVSINSLASIASIVGDPARASILQALLDMRALTATELARVAGVTPQTASGHLNQLTASGLLSVERQGRHRYFRLGSARVAQLFETLLQISIETSPPASLKIVTGPKDRDLRKARTCYDHLAGKLAVDLTDAMLEQQIIELTDDGGSVTDRGMNFFQKIGIEWDASLRPFKGRSRLVCRPCLDWSERRPHIAGRLGAALCQHCLNAGWVRRRENSRALDITPAGHQAFHRLLGLRLQVS